MATLKDITGYIDFTITLERIDIIDGEDDRYKYISFNGFLKHGDSIIYLNEQNHISIYLLKIMIFKMQELYDGILHGKNYDKKWTFFSIEPLDQSFALKLEFQGFEEESCLGEIVKSHISLHSFITTKGKYPGYLLTISSDVRTTDLYSFISELKNELAMIYTFN